MAHEATPYDGVIPTGWLTAYGKTFTDIAYSRDMFDGLETIRLANGPDERLATMKDTRLAPQFEARHKLLNRIIRSTGIKQVMEIAAGFSTRGLELTADSEVVYVEVDLPGVVTDKHRVLDMLRAKGAIPQRPNLFLEAGSAVNEQDLLHAAAHFDDSKPVIIAHEGLLRYLRMDEKSRCAHNVKALLQEFGGVWVTPDICLPSITYKQADVMAERRKGISAITGVNTADNLFKDEADAREFFEGQGFSIVWRHSFAEVIDELTSPVELHTPRESVEEMIAPLAVFVMSLA